ncbi:hypothetical protein HPB47_021574, partial [Ixodes persulcatus]
MACVTTDAKALAATREILIMGDFNGHLHELDGLEDENGRMIMQMAEDNTLEIVNLRASCEGQYTWNAQTKKTLQVYLTHKTIIASEALLYDNSLGSRLLSEARAGALRTLVYRRRFDATVTTSTCRVCGGYDETVEHIVLDCAGLQPSRFPRLQSPLVLAG